jgi:hypothetical protein
MDANDILEIAFQDRLDTDNRIADATILERVRLVSQTQHAITRFVMACCLAKVHNETLDIRKPYTQIGGNNSYSGRSYDEQYITAFIFKHELPCNPTTAFLTPALRNHNRIMTLDLQLEGRPAALYKTALELLDDIANSRVTAKMVLSQMIRELVATRDAKRERMVSLLQSLETHQVELPLSVERILTLIEQHLKLPHSSRLPVLIVAAAYESVGATIEEHIRPLQAHNAADSQTGAVGDVEIVLKSDHLIAAYEMKMRRVNKDDIDAALQKLQHHRIEHYVFITTEPVEFVVHEYAASLYALTGGTEVVILDCMGFLRHFLHFFHQNRQAFLEIYQRLVLNEPESAVRQELKEAWLALRQAAQT